MQKQLKLLVVGSFLAEEKQIFGGIARSCQTMMRSTFSDRFNIIPVDSTQISNPPPGFTVRTVLAIRRMIIYIQNFIRHRPDGVLLFTAVGASFIEKCVMGWISRLFGCPVFIFPRGGKLIDQATQTRFRRVFFRILLKGSNVFLAQGPKWMDFAINDMGFDVSRVYVIPNWTATERHLSIGSNRELKFISKRPQILFVGWLEEFKGVFELLNVCKILVGEGIEFDLTFVGRGHAEAEARSFVEKNDMGGVVSFIGWIEAEKLEQVYSSSDIFVLPSWSEGMPNSVIEAMAAALAVIVTTVGMITDFLRDGEHALLIPPHEESALEDALRRVLQENGLRERLAINGHRLVKDKFSVEPTLNKLGDIVEAIIVG